MESIAIRAGRGSATPAAAPKPVQQVGAPGAARAGFPRRLHAGLGVAPVPTSRGRLKALPALIAILAACGPAPEPEDRPPRFDVVEATIPELQAALADGRVTSAQLVEAYLARIEAYDERGPRLTSIVRVNPDARAEARALDEERAATGPRGPLHGIPVIVKDNYDVAGMPTTAGSVALAGLVPPDDAFQVRKLREAGAVILAKANMHELASGISTISSLGGQSRNPYDPTRNPGGSSGGTGAAVAASFAAVGWGSDTCGSIRIPASHNNLFGLRPTKGLSSIDGILPLSHTQDVGGPLARTVTDLAIALDATVGPDPADPATGSIDFAALGSFLDALDAGALQGVRLGVLNDRFGNGPAEREMSRVVRAALEEMRVQGAEVVEVEIEDVDELLEGSGVINLEFKFDLIGYLEATPGAPVSSLDDILAGGLVHEALEGRMKTRNAVESRDSEEYRNALAKQARLREAIVATLDRERLDALAYPTMRQEPSRIPDPQSGSNCSLAANSGLPAISAPAGFTASALPAGIELLGRPLADARLVAMAYAFEQVTDHRRRPPTSPELVNGAPPAPIEFRVVATAAAEAASPTGATPATGGGLEPAGGTPQATDTDQVDRVEETVTAEGRFALDPTTNVLSYEVTVTGAAPESVHAIVLQRGETDRMGPVLYRLSGPERTEPAGSIQLSAVHRADLEEGRVYLRLYTWAHPGGAARAQLRW